MKLHSEYVHPTKTITITRKSEADTPFSRSPSPDPPFTVYGGVYRAEAILLLRKFYVQENEKGMLESSYLPRHLGKC